MIASAQTLRLLKPVDPFVERSVAHGMTYGVGPAGYDVRIAEDVQMWPGTFKLASCIERFNMPNNLLGVVHDKSTWARLGLAVQNTVIEPGWRGFLTIELTNHSGRYIRLRQGMPICQIIFHMLDLWTDSPYNGKYQDQKQGPQAALLEGPSPLSSLPPTSHK